jgi:hypothetical protein
MRAIFIAAVFFAPGSAFPAHAATIYEQLDSSATYDNFVWHLNSPGPGQIVRHTQSFTVSSTRLLDRFDISVKFFFGRASWFDYEFYLYDDGSPVGFPEICRGIMRFTPGMTGVVSVTMRTYVTAGPCILEPGHNYNFRFNLGFWNGSGGELEHDMDLGSAVPNDLPIYMVVHDTSTEQDAKEPVIIVPGIMGTRLNRVSDGEEIWPNFLEMIRPVNDSDVYLNELKLDDFGKEVVGKEMNPSAVVDVVATQTVYENLKDTFVQSGYIIGQNLFEIPYDWRLGLSSSTQQLDSAVQQAIQNSPTGQVNIVAHSMGGVLTKTYLSSATSTSFLNKLVLLGSPMIGSPKAFKVLQEGDNMGFSILFGSFDVLSQERVKEISQNMLGVYELLPSRRYVAVNGGYVEDFRSTDPKAALNYDQTEQFMLENPSDSRNPLLLDAAEGFHENLDNNPINAPSVYNIVGCQNAQTIGAFRIYDDGKIDITATNGDGTVPLTSAMNLASGYTENYFVRYDQTGIDHQDLVVDDRTTALIASIIEGSAIFLPSGVSMAASDCSAAPTDQGATTIAVSTHSPVELHAYDAQNRHTGPVTNGDIELGIPGSSYEKLGENSFAFVPGGRQYRFVADSLAEGVFDMKVRSYAGSNLLDTTTYLNIPLASEQTMAELPVSGGGELSRLQLDHDGNGSFETSIPPTAVLDASSSMDVVPPTVMIMSPTSTDYTRPTVIPLIVNIEDSSEIAIAEIKLDGQATTNATIDSFFLKLGEHVIAVHAVDNVGNPTNATISFHLIATPQSTISDIERAYSLGWITKKNVRNALVAQTKAMIRLGDKIDKILAMLLIKELAFWHQRGVINDAGYNLLKEDIEWLVNN